MANLLFRIFLAVSSMVLIVLAIGSFLPRGYQVSASTTIDAGPDEIFPHINRLKSWQSWSNWNSHDIPKLEISYSGRELGEGAVQTWTEPRGKGKLWITESQENESIDYESEFAQFPLMKSNIRLEPTGDETKVVWTSSGSLPSGPFYGWFAGTFSSAMQAEYDRSLGKLKRLVESKKESAIKDESISED